MRSQSAGSSPGTASAAKRALRGFPRAILGFGSPTAMTTPPRTLRSTHRTGLAPAITAHGRAVPRWSGRVALLLLVAALLAGGSAGKAGADGVNGYLAISAGGHFACGIRADHTLACWGDTLYGQDAVPAGRFTQLSAGEFHACALRTDGTAACWGYYGAATIAAPQGAFTQVAAGYATDCGLTTAGTLYCWNAATHVAAPAGQRLTAVSTGLHAICGLATAGVIRCGDEAEAAPGAPTPPGGAFTQISGSADQFCALRRDGTAACWGSSGEGPALAPPTSSFMQVSTGRAHACGLLATGNARCWGRDHDGETQAPPALFTQVSAGDDLSCGLRRDGSVQCWGSNVYGQLRPPHNLPNAAIYLANTFQSYGASVVRIGVAGSPRQETGLVIQADGRHAYVLTAGRLLRGVDPRRITIETPAGGGRQSATAMSLTAGAHTQDLLAVIAFPSRARYPGIAWGNSYRLVQDPAVFAFYLGPSGLAQPRRAPLTITAVDADRRDSLGSFWIEYAHAPAGAQPGDALITADGSLLGITIAVRADGTAEAVQSHWAAPVVQAQVTALVRQLG